MTAEEIHDRLQRLKARGTRPKRFMVVGTAELTPEQDAWVVRLEADGFHVVILREADVPAPKGKAA